jgi:hypothetical protein
MQLNIVVGLALAMTGWSTLARATTPPPLAIEHDPAVWLNPDASNLKQLRPEEPSVAPTAPSPPVKPPASYPLQEAAYGLLGFETATPIGKDRLLMQFGGTSFNNPTDFRGGSPGNTNRSNDAHWDLVYGISPDLQINAALSGKDDTVFTNLIRNQSRFQIINNVVPIQGKWRFYNRDRLQGSVVVGTELANPFSALFFQAGKSVTYSQLAANGINRNTFTAEDRSLTFGVGLPMSYQATEQLRLHLNPRVSFFPSQLAATTSSGDLTAIRNAGVGFDGNNLNYYGTVAGIGLGVSYSLSPQLKVAADITPIISGKNTFTTASGGSSLSANPVWNVGMQYTPNSRTAIGIYATNRYSATSASPSNLLVQPGNDWAVGLNVSYLEGNPGDTPQSQRSSYPSLAAFWGGSASYPATTLPQRSVLYQLGVGNRGQVNPNFRYGLLDDLEVAFNHNNTGRREMAIETSLMGRWGLLPDRGEPGFAGTMGLGLVRIDGPGLLLGYSLYSETPLLYRLPGGKLSFSATPKLVIPAQFQNVPRTLAVTLGADWQVSDRTQVFGSVTPSLIGDNQLIAGRSLGFQGRTPVYNLGVRQLFPNGNSTYGVELYYGNGAGSTGYQSTSALPSGDTQFGLRFSLLNGTP